MCVCGLVGEHVCVCAGICRLKSALVTMGCVAWRGLGRVDSGLS